MGRLTTFHPAVFFLTFISYALYHIVRKTQSYVQSSLISEWTPTTEHHNLTDTTLTRSYLFQDQLSAEAFIGILNAIFLFVYALGNFISGMIADRLDHRLFLTVGMMMCAIVMFIFGPVLEWTGGYSQAAYVILQTLNALFQSTGWPCAVAVMANWFDKRSRGYILGVWSSSPSAGSILGALMISSVVGYGYEYAFVLTTSLLFAGGVLVFFGLVISPHEVGLTILHNADDDNDDIDARAQSNGEREKLLAKTMVSYEKSIRPTLHCSSDQSRNNKACSVKYTHVDKRSTDFNSTVRVQTDTIPLLNNPTPSSPIHKWTLSADSDTDTDLNSDDEHNITNVERHTRIDNESTRTSVSITDTEHKNNSDFGLNSHDHEKRLLLSKNIHLDNDSERQELIQTNNSDNSNSDTIGNSSLSIKINRKASMKHGVIYTRPKAIGFIAALLLPGVIPYLFCFAFLKLVLYVFFFWLPYYLSSAYGWTESTADSLSLWYDVGGIVGASINAFLMSRLNKSAILMIPMLLASIPLLYIYGALYIGQDMTINAVMLFCIGGLLGGVGNILSAAVSADLSHQKSVVGNVEAMSTVAGMIEGSGTVGAALGQLAVPYLYAVLGWSMVFYLLMLSTFLSAMSILPLLVSEVKDVLRSKNK